jgi:hypothetical protein
VRSLSPAEQIKQLGELEARTHTQHDARAHEAIN